MSVDNLKLSNSPSSLIKEGKFASKKPYIIVGVLIALFLIGMIYATSVRGEKRTKQQEKEIIAKSDNSKINELLEGLKKIKKQKIVKEKVIVHPKPIILEAPRDRNLTEAEKERLRIIKLKQKRLEEAVNAPMGVSSGGGLFDLSNNKTINNLNTGSDNPGMAMMEKYLDNYDKFNSPKNSAASMKPNKSEQNTIFNHQDDGYLEYSKQKLISQYELKTGSLIPAILISGINSDLPGKILAQVRENIYDTATGNHLLIPQGTKIIGIYGHEPKYGQNRALVVFNRLIFPDGQTLNIGAMNGVDSAGYAGFEDTVDHHYFRVFGSAFLMSMLGGDIGFSNGKLTFRTGQNEQVQRRETALEKAAGKMIEKGLNVSPTIKIRQGYRFNIFVTKDMILEPLSSYIDDSTYLNYSKQFRKNNKHQLDVEFDRQILPYNYSGSYENKNVVHAYSRVLPIQ